MKVGLEMWFDGENGLLNAHVYLTIYYWRECQFQYKMKNVFWFPFLKMFSDLLGLICPIFPKMS